MAGGAWRDRRTWILAGITVGTLLIGWLAKQPCLANDWGGGFAFRHYCYSDVQALYGTRGAADGQWPYLNTFNEYPVLTGLFMHAVGELASGRGAYVAWTAVLLGTLAVVTTVLLADLVGPTRKVLYWAIGPSVAVYYAYNWDVLAVAAAVGGVWAYRRERWWLSGLLLGLGACAKLWPAFLLPALGLALWRSEGRLGRRSWSFGVAAVGAMVALNLPFYLASPELFLETYTFQGGRGANLESVWYVVGHMGREWDQPWMDALSRGKALEIASFLPFFAAVLVSGWAAWTRRLDAVAAAALPVFAFLAFNKVFSLQYVLWALPLLVLTHRSTGQKVAVVVADLAVLTTLFAYFAISDITTDAAIYFPVAVAVLARAAAFAWCLASLAREAAQAPADAAVAAVAANAEPGHATTAAGGPP